MDNRLVGILLVMVAMSSCGPHIPHGRVRAGIPHPEAHGTWLAVS